MWRKITPILIILLMMIPIISTPFFLKQTIVERTVIKLTFGNQEIVIIKHGNKIINTKVIKLDNKEKIFSTRTLEPTILQLIPVNYYDVPSNKKKMVFKISGTGITTLFTENFEIHAVPGSYWSSWDYNLTGENISWGNVSTACGFRAYSGSRSIWCGGYIYGSKISGKVIGDGTQDWDTWNFTSSSWWGISAYLENGKTYTFQLDWDSNEDLDLFVYTPNKKLFDYNISTTKPETLTITANESGWWYIIVDDWTDSSGVTSSFTITITQGNPLHMRAYYFPVKEYSNYMTAITYYNYSYFDISEYDLIYIRFQAWWNVEKDYDYFEVGPLLDNGSLYVLRFTGQTVEYNNSFGYGKWFEYNVSNVRDNGWGLVTIILRADFFYNYNITPAFSFESNSLTAYEGAYVDDIELAAVDITLDGYSISPNPAYPGDQIIFGWYVNNPLDTNITNVNLSIYLQHVDTGKTWVFFLPVNLTPGVKWYYGAPANLSIFSDMPAGYYNLRYIIWSGKLGDSRIWHDTGWIKSGFQLKHKTSLSFGANSYSGEYSDSITITVSLTDTSNNSAILGRSITLYYYNGTHWISLGTATTDTNGQATFNVELTMDSGTYDLKAEFAGDDYYDAAIVTLSNGLIVNPEKTQITFSSDSYLTYYGDPITIAITLKDNDNTPLEGLSVTFYYSTDNGITWISIATKTTDANGQARIVYTLDFSLDAGDYLVKAEFAGTKNYESTYATVIFSINPEKTQLALDANNYTVDYEDQLVISAKLTDDEGYAISGQTIYFEYYNGSTWITLDSTSTDNYGQAIVTLTISLTPGSYSIRARFDGNKNYQGTVSSAATLTVNKETTNLSDPSTSGYYSDSVIIQTKLIEEEGNPLSDKVIYFYIDDDLVGSTVTDKDGIASIIVQLNYAPGSHTLKVEFQGDSYYQASSCLGILTVNKEITQISLKDVSGNYSDAITISATLTEDDGLAISGETIYFEYYNGSNWILLKSALTDDKGTALIQIVLDMIPGNYSLRARFDGNDYYASSLAEAILTVNKEMTVINLKDVSGNYSDTITISATLTDNEGSTISGKVIYFKYNNGTSWILIGGTYTDTKGIAIIQFSLDMKPGNYTLKAMFVGDDYYCASFGLATLTVNKEKTIFAYVDGIGRYGDDTIFKALLTDDENIGIPNVTIYFELFNETTQTWIYLGNATTDSKGYAKLTLALVFSSKNYTIRAIFYGNDYYLSCSAEGMLIFDREITILSVTSKFFEVKWKQSINITVILTDDENNALGNLNVSFIINISGQNITIGSTKTNASGFAIMEYYADINPGNYTLYAIFEGNEYYYPVSIEIPLRVLKLDTFIDIASATLEGNYGDTITWTVKLYNEYSEVLPNRSIILEILDDDKVLNQINSTTNASGFAEFIIVLNYTPKNYTIVISFNGDDYYAETSISSILTIRKEITIIHLNNVTVAFSDSVKIIASLNDDEGYKLIGKTINICILNENEIIDNVTVTTDKNGTAEYLFLANIKPGNYTLLATFNGDEYYVSSSKASKLVVTKEKAILSFETIISEIYIGTTYIINATLTDDDNIPIIDAEIKLYLNNTFLGSAITDKSGKACIEILLKDINEGTYILLAKFDENEYYTGASASMKVEVKMLIRLLNIEFLEPQYKVQYTDTIDISVRVTSDNESISGILIKFYINNSGILTFIGSAITNGNGIAGISWKADILPGNYELVAIFEGDSQYKEVATTAELMVFKEATKILLNSVETEYNSSVILHAILTTDDDEPISNALISFYIKTTSEQFLGENRTQEDGSVIIKIYATFDVGEYVIEAIYQGDDKFQSTKAEAKLTINPAKLLIKVKIDEKFTVGKPAQIYVHAFNKDYRALDNVTIEIYVNNTLFTQGYTRNGEFVTEYTPRKAGTIIIKVVAHKQNYERKELTIYKVVTAVKMQSAITQQLLTALILSVIGIGAILIMRLRKRQKYKIYARKL